MKAFPVFMSQWKNHYGKLKYREQNNNVYLTLHNRVTAHEKTVSTATMLQIEKNGQTTTTPKKPFCFIYLQMVRRYCQN